MKMTNSDVTYTYTYTYTHIPNIYTHAYTHIKMWMPMYTTKSKVQKIRNIHADENKIQTVN